MAEPFAQSGDPVGQRNLAALYFKGEGVPQDYVHAAELYGAAAAQAMPRRRTC